MTNPNKTTDTDLDDPYVRVVPAEEFIDEVEKASEEQTSDEEE